MDFLNKKHGRLLVVIVFPILNTVISKDLPRAKQCILNSKQTMPHHYGHKNPQHSNMGNRSGKRPAGHRDYRPPHMYRPRGQPVS